MIRVTKDRKRKYVSLGISLNPDNWNFSKNKPKADCPNREYIELLIAEKLKTYTSKLIELKVTNQDYIPIFLPSFYLQVSLRFP